MKNAEGPGGAGGQSPVEMPGGHGCVTPLGNTQLLKYTFGFGRQDQDFRNDGAGGKVKHVRLQGPVWVQKEKKPDGGGWQEESKNVKAQQ